MNQALREACFLIDSKGRLLWRDASTSPSRLPDSRERWEAIWSHREVLAEIAHSHPRGPLAFSSEDETTFAALRAGLGPGLIFSVLAPSGLLRRLPSGADEEVSPGPTRAAELRRLSGFGAWGRIRLKLRGRRCRKGDHERPWDFASSTGAWS